MRSGSGTFLNPSSTAKEVSAAGPWACLECTAISAAIYLHFGKPVLRRRESPLAVSRFQKLVFRNEEKLGLWINETPNEPRAGNAVHFDIASYDPLHVSTLPQEAAC